MHLCYLRLPSIMEPKSTANFIQMVQPRALISGNLSSNLNLSPNTLEVRSSHLRNMYLNRLFVLPHKFRNNLKFSHLH
jgi:hypothetical protein